MKTIPLLLAAALAFAVSILSTSAAPGDLDASFGSGGKVVSATTSGDEFGRSVAIQSDGKIVVAGYSYSGSDAELTVLRYTI